MRDFVNRLLGSPKHDDGLLRCKHCGAGLSRLHMTSGTDGRHGVKMILFCRDCHKSWTVKGSDMGTRAAFLQLLNQSRRPYRSEPAQPVSPIRMGGLPHD